MRTWAALIPLTLIPPCAVIATGGVACETLTMHPHRQVRGVPTQCGAGQPPVYEVSSMRVVSVQVPPRTQWGFKSLGTRPQCICRIPGI